MTNNTICEPAYRPLLDNEKVRIMFLFQMPAMWASMKTFYEACLSDERFETKLFHLPEAPSSEHLFANAAQFLAAQNIPYDSFSEEAFYAFAPHAVVLQTPYDAIHRLPNRWSSYFASKGIRVVYTSYGIEFSNNYADRRINFRESVQRHAWRIYTFSPLMLREYEKYCENYKAVRVTGTPRFDLLANKSNFTLPDEVRSMAKGRRIIFWQIHFVKATRVDGVMKQYTPYLPEYVEFAKRVADFQDSVFVVARPHPMFYTDPNNPSPEYTNIVAETDKWRPVLLKAIDDAPNIFLDRSSDYHDTLMNADAIITDWSSITMEAAVTGVPVMYVKNKDCESAFLPAVADILRSYYQGLGCADMLEFVGAVIDGRDPQRGRRQEAIEKCLPYLDGKCGKRMADDVYCGIAEPEKAGKLRVILFGTGRVFSTICGYPLKDGIEAIAAADNDSRKWGTVVNGFKVIAPHEMQDYVFDRIVVAVNSDQYEQILMQLYSEYDIPLSKITRVDSFLEMLDI